MRVMNVRRPGLAVGVELVDEPLQVVEPVVDGPSFTPIGLRMREK